jgi:hypothetical protein
MISRTSLRTYAVGLGDIFDGNGDVRHAGIGDDTGPKLGQVVRSGSMRGKTSLWFVVLRRRQDTTNCQGRLNCRGRFEPRNTRMTRKIQAVSRVLAHRVTSDRPTSVKKFRHSGGVELQ